MCFNDGRLIPHEAIRPARSGACRRWSSSKRVTVARRRQPWAWIVRLLALHDNDQPSLRATACCGGVVRLLSVFTRRPCQMGNARVRPPRREAATLGIASRSSGIPVPHQRVSGRPDPVWPCVLSCVPTPTSMPRASPARRLRAARRRRGPSGPACARGLGSSHAADSRPTAAEVVSDLAYDSGGTPVRAVGAPHAAGVSVVRALCLAVTPRAALRRGRLGGGDRC